MLNQDLHLSDKLFSEELEKKPTREGMGSGLKAVAEINDRVVGLCADLTESTRMNVFADAFPDRFVQVGVAEQNLVATASGLAAAGKIPYASSYAAFMPGRCWEQIRTTICYNDQPVKLIGAHAGLQTGPDGATHQMLEDLALMRVLPNMVVINPCDVYEAHKATMAAADINQPVYIRVQRDKSPVVTTEDTPFEIGKAYVWHQGEGLTIISSGAIAYQALVAAKELNAEMINVPTIKPLDSETILNSVRKTNKVMVVEEHQVAGGLGSAITELITEHHPVLVKRVGMYDTFGESGEPDELIEHFKLTSPHLIQSAKEFLG